MIVASLYLLPYLPYPYLSLSVLITIPISPSSLSLSLSPSLSCEPSPTGVYEQRLPKFLEALQWWRERLRLLVYLTAGYVDRQSTKRWYYTQCTSPMGRIMSQQGIHLGAAMYGMLFTGEYKKCELRLAVSPTSVIGETRHVHPTCQCGLKPKLRPGALVLTRQHGDIRQLPAWKATYVDPSNGSQKRYPGLGNWTLQEVPTHWARTPGLTYLGKPEPLEGPYKPEGPWLPGEGNAFRHKSSKLIRVPWWVSETTYKSGPLKASKDRPYFWHTCFVLGWANVGRCQGGVRALLKETSPVFTSLL